MRQPERRRVLLGPGRAVNVCSWGEYIETDLIDQFEDETGIKVNYTTTESNETLYSLLKTGGSSYDVIVPSDYMLSRLIAEGMLEPLDFSNIPNFDQIGDDYKIWPTTRRTCTRCPILGDHWHYLQYKDGKGAGGQLVHPL